MSEIKLTKREQQVLEWVQRGASNKEIGKRLGVSDATIKAHMTKILKKHCLRNRSQLAVYTTQGKTITLPDYIPEHAEAKPCGWVLRKKESIVAFSFEKSPLSSDWEPIYIGKNGEI